MGSFLVVMGTLAAACRAVWDKLPKPAPVVQASASVASNVEVRLHVTILGHRALGAIKCLQRGMRFFSNMTYS